MSPIELVRLLAELCDVLAAVHARGVTHRDLKPDNILLTPCDREFPLRIIDWGTAFIEANQRGYRSATIGKDVKARRPNSAPHYVAIADRCHRRLNKKGNRLLLSGKHPNKVKVACAREMVGFVWESLRQAKAA